MGGETHQTIKLSRGKHKSPHEGACVMELASMLAGEPFSDHPVSVCPVIGAFLRAYNDSIDSRRRQDLYAYASKVVGSRGSEGLQDARLERLQAWAEQRRRRSWTSLLIRSGLRAIAPKPPIDVIGTTAVHSIRHHDHRSHAEALALIDELLVVGRDGQDLSDASPRRGSVPIAR